MEFPKRVACSDSLNRSAFSIKNILNFQNEREVVDFSGLTGENFNDETFSIPRNIVAPVPYNPPPLMYPCTSFGLPLCAPIHYWTSFGAREETRAWTPNKNFVTHQFFPGK